MVSACTVLANWEQGYAVMKWVGKSVGFSDFNDDEIIAGKKTKIYSDDYKERWEDF